MNKQLIDRAQRLFADHFGHECVDVTFAPGRVNLIGEHVDYNDGLVLPMPVLAGTAVAWSRRQDGKAAIYAADFGEADCFKIDNPRKSDQANWKSYCRGMVAHLSGQSCGMNILITGDLPKGSGLSSSASLCIALGRAIVSASGNSADAKTLALAAQKTEHDFAGVACGIMDQMAIAAGQKGHAILLDCRTLSFQQISIPEDWAVLILDSGVTRELKEGAYNERRQQCKNAAKAMAVNSLRDAKLIDLANSNLPDVEDMRARHVINEITRVRAAANAIEAGDIQEFGRLLAESHNSLRDLFEVSHPQVNKLVAKLQSVIGSDGGARMTGAGFGGSVVAVLQRNKVHQLAKEFDHPFVQIH